MVCWSMIGNFMTCDTMTKSTQQFRTRYGNQVRFYHLQNNSMEKYIQKEVRSRVFAIIWNRYLSIQEQANKLIDEIFLPFENKVGWANFDSFRFYNPWKENIISMIYKTLWRPEWQSCTIRDKYINAIATIIIEEYARIITNTTIEKFTPMKKYIIETKPKKKKRFLFF